MKETHPVYINVDCFNNFNNNQLLNIIDTPFSLFKHRL